MGANEFIIKLINMSITASYVTVIVLVLRLFMKRFPKKYSYALWSIVGLRLALPFSFSSAFSFFNLPSFREVNTGGRLNYVPADIEFSYTPRVNTGISAVNDSVNAMLPAAEQGYGVNPMQGYLTSLFYIWIIGAAVIIAYEIFRHTKTRKLVRQAVLYRDNIYECDNIPTPFVMGVISPKIYVPFRLNERELSYIICHEKYHIKRLDHIVKIFAFLLIVVHWFNPLVWLAYFCMNADMEKSCDEFVLMQMGDRIKNEYSTSLLSFAINRRHLPLGPLAFGESAVTERTKNVLKFKKPSRLLSIIGIVIVLAAGCICVTNGKTADVNEGVIAWADAFCDRDGKAIRSMLTDEAAASLIENEFFYDEESFAFGWSSPWPWGGEYGDTETERYKIIKNGDKDVILYYAKTSDPHIWIWRETLDYEVRDGSFLVIAESMELMENISSAGELYRAYPENIEDTFMDYGTNGLGEYLNENYLRDKELLSSKLDLLDAECAALYLLNISKEAVETEQRISPADQTEALVNVTFTEDGTTVQILMTRPFGSDGIWIPKHIIMPDDGDKPVLRALRKSSEQ